MLNDIGYTAERSGSDEIMFECLHKCVEIIVQSRQLNAKQLGRRGRVRFNLEIDEIKLVRDAMEPIGLRPFCVDVFCKSGTGSNLDPTPPPQQSPRYGHPHWLLERWHINYSKVVPPPLPPSGNPLAQLPNVCKRIAILLRTLYSYVRMLPAYQLHRRLVEARNQFTSPMQRGLMDDMGWSFSSGLSFPYHTPTKEYTFASLDTPYGNLSISTAYVNPAEPMLPMESPPPSPHIDRAYQIQQHHHQVPQSPQRGGGIGAAIATYEQQQHRMNVSPGADALRGRLGSEDAALVNYYGGGGGGVPAGPGLGYGFITPQARRYQARKSLSGLHSHSMNIIPVRNVNISQGGEPGALPPPSPGRPIIAPSSGLRPPPPASRSLDTDEDPWATMVQRRVQWYQSGGQQTQTSLASVMAPYGYDRPLRGSPPTPPAQFATGTAVVPGYHTHYTSPGRPGHMREGGQAAMPLDTLPELPPMSDAAGWRMPPPAPSLGRQDKTQSDPHLLGVPRATTPRASTSTSTAGTPGGSGGASALELYTACSGIWRRKSGGGASVITAGASVVGRGSTDSLGSIGGGAETIVEEREEGVSLVREEQAYTSRSAAVGVASIPAAAPNMSLQDRLDSFRNFAQFMEVRQNPHGAAADPPGRPEA